MFNDKSTSRVPDMNEQDKAVFEEYFQLEHQVGINLQKGELLSQSPSLEEFEASIPLPFKLASDMKGVEQNMLRPLRQLGDVIEPLADYLKAQSRKIDLMMSYILQAQDESDTQLKTDSYGGGGFTLTTADDLDVDYWYTCKLFFQDEASAIYCLVRIIDVQDLGGLSDLDDSTIESSTDPTIDTSESSLKKYKLVFHRIREEDQELVVRASLHQQSKQLLKKTKQRQNENNQ